jgi:hypothetical protein
MPSNRTPCRGGGPSPSQVQDRASTADPAGLDRPGDQDRLESELQSHADEPCGSEPEGVTVAALLDRIPVPITNAASVAAYLSSYLVVAVGSGAFLVGRIASLGVLTQSPHGALVALYALVWFTVLYAARPLVREGLLHLSVTWEQVCQLVLMHFGFDPAKPYVLAYRLWNKRPGKPAVLYIKH